MIDMSTYWVVVPILGLGTYLIRLSFILLMERIPLPQAAHRMLRFIPASVLPALVLPAVLFGKTGTTPLADPARTGAALVAMLVAWKTRNTLATIGAGMAALWTLQAVL
ncbi:MAG: AzlD domain-containing protein [Pseudodesulfovibrio sp.]|uniref:Branched-chain amino acid transport n=2 Tax=Desulfovibrionaceae TaxID=194924 RepID=E6VVV4_PSEA9|nr:branched-chain amino acid transport [Pseudodesulfovibrio aespoeensis Aspo-2]MBU4190893.1 AzlD domain-containing protein [Pseudomonadota bacterium]MBV1765617.1 AzlD domain-containing protein [Pseudodesulfovibrio sp.]MBU4243970.1 AzlD domain-containing protein [Pseudomonadota bacterium]MBU4378332.1 AzlD domain-containing protein [Pseudomonadota bacterium]